MTRILPSFALLTSLALALGCSDGAGTVDLDPSGSSGQSSSGDQSSSSSGDVNTHERFCFTRPRMEFCEDFDETELPGAFAEVRTGERMSLQTAPSATPPRSMQLEVEGGAASLDSRLITRQFAARNKLRSMVQIKLAERAVGAGDEALRLVSHSFTTDSGTYRYSLATNDKGEWFGEELHTPSGGGEPVSKRFAASAGIPHDAWTTVRFQLDVSSSGAGTVKILIGLDQVVPTIAMATPPGALASTYSIGLDGQAPAQAWRAEFDTATFYFE